MNRHPMASAPDDSAHRSSNYFNQKLSAKTMQSIRGSLSDLTLEPKHLEDIDSNSSQLPESHSTSSQSTTIGTLNNIAALCSTMNRHPMASAPDDSAHRSSNYFNQKLSAKTMQSIRGSLSNLTLKPKHLEDINSNSSQLPALHSTSSQSTIYDPRLDHNPKMNRHHSITSIETAPSARLKPIDVEQILPESERSLSWTAVVAINEALKKHDPKVPISEFSNSDEYKAMCQLKDPPKSKTNFNHVVKLPISTHKCSPPSKRNSRQLEFDRRRIYDQIRHIIIKRIPEDSFKNYAPSQIIKQAKIFEALLFENKLSDEAYADMSTLENRVIHLATMSLKPWIWNRRLPKIIVHIDTRP